MSNTRHGTAATLGFGCAYLLAGGALLLQEAGLLTLSWSYVLPLILVTIGAVVLASALTGAHRAGSR